MGKYEPIINNLIYDYYKVLGSSKNQEKLETRLDIVENLTWFGWKRTSRFHGGRHNDCEGIVLMRLVIEQEGL